jgi:hypothetical protein
MVCRKKHLATLVGALCSTIGSRPDGVKGLPSERGSKLVITTDCRMAGLIRTLLLPALTSAFEAMATRC